MRSSSAPQADKSVFRGNVCALVLLAIGSLPMLGHVLGLDKLKGLGLVTAAAPYPKVFCDARCAGSETGEEFEPFAAKFTLLYKGPQGREQRLVITPEIYARLSGPYNRRNVYGAALAYAPGLPEAFWKQGFRYALLDPGTLTMELGLPENASNFRVQIESHTAGRDGQSWTLQP